MNTSFISWIQDEPLRRNCASGGVATALARYVLTRGGMVVGAAYADDMSVRHICVECDDELVRLCGVKYAFSEIAPDVYQRIAQVLSHGRIVLFVGLPCQAAAMRKRFGGDTKLILADLVCFGAPAQSVWIKYVAWLQRNRNVRLVGLNPRDKGHGWGRKTYYSYDWSDGTHENRLSVFDPYAQLFYSAKAFRRCCYQCPFRGENHKSDVTIGDAWGYENDSRFGNVVCNGISAVTCHTDAGRHILEASGVTRCSVPTEDVFRANRPYFESPALPVEYDTIIRDVKQMDFQGLINRYGLQLTRFGYMRARIRRFLCHWKRRVA